MSLSLELLTMNTKARVTKCFSFSTWYDEQNNGSLEHWRVFFSIVVVFSSTFFYFDGELS